MAEALGIAGGIASLIGLIKQLQSFNKLCQNLRDVPEDIQRISTEIAMLRCTLNASERCSQQLEGQGFEAGDFRFVQLKTSEWLTRVEQTLEVCTAKVSAGKRLTLGKRMRLLLNKKEIENRVGELERMKTTWMVAKRNLDGHVNQKQHGDIQVSINDLRNDLFDLKPVLLDIQRNNRQTAVDLEQQEQQLIKDKSCEQIPNGRRKSPEIPHIYTTALKETAKSPFHLLVTCIFLNTKRQAAISQARSLLQRFPSPETLAKAQYHEVQPFFAHLGLFQRAKWLIRLAEVWLERPPQAKKLYRKRAGKPAFRSEVAHLQGVGQFANDAWRIFCKDDMYIQAGYSITLPEWKTVLPTDEGLIAYLRDGWDKEGFIWDAKTGHLQKRDVEILVKETDGFSRRSKVP